MDFYSILLAKSSGESGGDPAESFKLCISGNLTTITEEMLDGITTLHEYIFYNNRYLRSIEIPNSVTSIGTNAFNGCSNLTSVTVRRTTPPTLGNKFAFSNGSSSLVIYVPSESVNRYKSVANWSNFASKIQAIPS